MIDALAPQTEQVVGETMAEGPEVTQSETALNPSLYFDTANGYVRQRVTQENLSLMLRERFMADERLHCLDFGGAEGRDAIWLAEQGHRVVVASTTPSVREAVQTAVENQQREVQGRISLAQNPSRLLRRALHRRRKEYDVIVDHGFLPDELDTALDRLDTYRRVIKHGGVLSLLADAGVEEIEETAESNRFIVGGIYTVGASVASPEKLRRELRPGEDRKLIQEALEASRTASTVGGHVVQLLATRR